MTTRRMTVSEIRALIAGAPPEPGDSLWRELTADPRKGVHALLASLLRGEERRRRERERLEALRRHEAALWSKGIRVVAGIDEAGRGPLAGPVYAAAVVLPREVDLPQLNDSKLLTPDVRSRLHDLIVERAEAVGVGSASESDIDSTNILKATMRAMAAAVKDLGVEPEHLLVDGSHELDGSAASQSAVMQGDRICAPIAAASIVAKVRRDRFMIEMDARYPGYGFARHKGYGTEEHIASLTRLGPCPIHRRSFSIVRECDDGPSAICRLFERRMLACDDVETLEAVSTEVAARAEELEAYELGRLRRLYKRTWRRIHAGIPARR